MLLKCFTLPPAAITTITTAHPLFSTLAYLPRFAGSIVLENGMKDASLNHKRKKKSFHVGRNIHRENNFTTSDAIDFTFIVAALLLLLVDVDA